MDFIKSFLGKFDPVKLIALLTYKFLPGQKTKIVAIVSMIVGFYNFIVSTELIQQLCTTYNICLEGNKYWGLFVAAIGLLTKAFLDAKALNSSMKR